MPTSPVPLQSNPGIRRDGTVFDGDEYTDGEWCRFYRGRPKKIGGYTRRSNQVTGICRGMEIVSQNQYSFVHMGSQTRLEQINIDNLTGVASGVIDRSPVGFPSDGNYLWQLATQYDGGGTSMLVLAHAAPNLVSIASDVAYPAYYGDAFGSAALTEIMGSDVSGGIVSIFPYFLYYGSDGFLGWSVPNIPPDIAGAGAGDARICGSKVVRGMPLRGGAGNSPAGLFWGLDALVRMTFVGGAGIFDFDLMSGESSIISAASVVEFDGIYYWMGVDRFLMFNGIVREVPNTMNLNFTYDRVLRNPGRVFAIKVPRWGEIWWCFVNTDDPDATECNWAIIYNVREQKWYDTPLPASMRSAGHYAQTFPYPMMTSATPNDDGFTGLYQHEIGVDAVEDIALAIRSSFETANLSPLNGSPPSGKGLRCERVEPDFVQTGDLMLTVVGRQNARAADAQSVTMTIPDVPTVPAEQTTPFKDAAFRQMRFRFESNTLGGDYYAGKPIAHVEQTDMRVEGAVE